MIPLFCSTFVISKRYQPLVFPSFLRTKTFLVCAWRNFQEYCFSMLETRTLFIWQLSDKHCTWMTHVTLVSFRQTTPRFLRSPAKNCTSACNLQHFAVSLICLYLMWFQILNDNFLRSYRVLDLHVYHTGIHFKQVNSQLCKIVR